jgi:transcriptional regulator with XRE-family HTH domain
VRYRFEPAAAAAAAASRGKDQTVAETFGAALRRYRLAASLTQEALAERAAVSPTSIAALERGRRKAPRLSTLRQLGQALGLDAVELAEL